MPLSICPQREGIDCLKALGAGWVVFRLVLPLRRAFLPLFFSKQPFDLLINTRTFAIAFRGRVRKGTFESVNFLLGE